MVDVLICMLLLVNVDRRDLGGWLVLRLTSSLFACWRVVRNRDVWRAGQLRVISNLPWRMRFLMDCERDDMVRKKKKTGLEGLGGLEIKKEGRGYV